MAVARPICWFATFLLSSAALAASARPAAPAPTLSHARAVWLDGRTLRCPGVAATEPGTRVRPLHSARGQIVAPAVAERVRWIGSLDDLRTMPPAHRGFYLGFTHAGSDGMARLRRLAAAWS